MSQWFLSNKITPNSCLLLFTIKAEFDQTTFQYSTIHAIPLPPQEKLKKIPKSPNNVKPQTSSNNTRRQRSASPSVRHHLGTAFPHPKSQHTGTSQYPFTHHNQALLKKARGVCRGAVALRLLCGFHFFPKLNYRLINKFLFFVSFWTYLFNNCKKFNNFLVVFTIKKVYHIKINYRQ